MPSSVLKILLAATFEIPHWEHSLITHPNMIILIEEKNNMRRYPYRYPYF